MCFLRQYIRQYRNNTLAAQGHDRNDHIIVAAVDVDLIAALCSNLCGIANVSAGFLDCCNVLVLCQCCNGADIKTYAGTAGNIVKNDRQVYAVCNGIVMSCCNTG